MCSDHLPFSPSPSLRQGNAIILSLLIAITSHQTDSFGSYQVMAARICLHRLHLNPSQSSVLLPSRPFRPHPRSRSAITALPALRCCSEMSRKLQPAGAAAASSFASISSFSSEGSASQPEWNEKRSNMSQGMWEYVNRVGVRESPVLQRCRRETLEKLGTRAINQISPDEGQLLQWIVAALGVRQAIEIGQHLPSHPWECIVPQLKSSHLRPTPR